MSSAGLAAGSPAAGFGFLSSPPPPKRLITLTEVALQAPTLGEKVLVVAGECVLRKAVARILTACC